MDIQSFFKVTYGLYIVSSTDGEKLNGHISNTVFQVSAEPPRFAIATHKDNLTTDYIRKSRVFSISVLQQDVDLKFMGPWGFNSGREMDKFSSCNYKTGVSGAPIVLDKAIAYIDCKVDTEIDTGSHILFIGEAVDAQVLIDKALPLTYAYYRDVIKGLSPENAPTYTDKSKLAETEILAEGKLKKFQCLVCGYMYDPEEGDAPKNIPPGTSFDDLPDDWTCPVCGVGKSEFKEMD
ncbi:MAG: rubredoxin [Bacteroidales bacterium]|nr:rubredoxin [Bacteroidales bacterium]